jgi:predicted transcriptional regulator
MLKQTTIWLHDGHMKKLGALAQSRGLKRAQLVRIAILDYLRREIAKEAAK